MCKDNKKVTNKDKSERFYQFVNIQMSYYDCILYCIRLSLQPIKSIPITFYLITNTIMKKIRMLWCIMWSLFATTAYAQGPSLSKKQVLPSTLLQSKVISGSSTDVTTATTVVPKSNIYTLEVKAKVKSAVGRGLDIEASNENGIGFRTSLSSQKLYWSNPLTALQSLTSSDNAQSQTIRWAVDGTKVHVYQNGCYVVSKDLDEVKAIVDGKETSPYTFGSDNLIASAIPSTWESKPTPQSVGWNIVRNKALLTGKWPNSRFEKNYKDMKDVDGSAYKGSFFFFRWDNGSCSHDYYTFPVTLVGGTTYAFQMDYAYWSNYNGSNSANINVKGIQVGITQSNTVENIISSKTFLCKKTQQLETGNFTFTAEKSGTYYLTFCGGWGMYAIANLKVMTVMAPPHILIGNHEPGSVIDAEIEQVTFDDSGAYAPEEGTTTPSNVTLNDAGKVSLEACLNANVTVSGKTDLTITRAWRPIYNSKVNLQGNNAWLMLTGVKPSEVEAVCKDMILINGKPLKHNSINPEDNNARIAIYGSGSVIIPGGEDDAKKAIVLYDEENCKGDSLELAADKTYNQLGDWDNKARSFALRRGFMATLANNADGSGFSRVFIAADSDIVLPILPEGMEKFVSYVRVFKWQWTSKKGKAGNPGSNQLNVTNFYNWNIDGNSNDPDVEYASIRQNLYWPNFQSIVAKPNVTHLLGCNEPDRPDQANAKADEVVRLWPDMMRTGYRLGSPAPSSVWPWIGDFMNTCDSLNYRVDFMAAHVYEAIGGSGIASRVKTLSDKGKGRPVWITEWNNGANWTTESWPTAEGTRVDVDGNPILDSEGKEQTVKRPLSPENAEKQRAFMAEALPSMDNIELLEHYYEYDWVQDARALELNGKLTPAGKVYAEHRAAIGYNAKHEYIHKWKIAPPFPLLSLDSSLDTLVLSWYDHNGETGKKYILERKMDSDSEFTPYKELLAGNDYSFGGTVSFREAIPCEQQVTYRIKALSYNDTESIYSREINFKRDAAAAAPTLTGEAVSSQIIQLKWNTVDNARSYRIERADAKNGDYKVIANQLTETAYTDKGLKPNTTYYYRVYSLNTSTTHPVSDVLAVATKKLSVPAAMTGVHAASGNSCATLVWDFTYDALYSIMRADKKDGTYSVVADSIDGTRYVDRQLNNGTTYYYKVLPFNDAGEGPTTEVMTVTPQDGQYLHLAFDETSGNVAIDNWGAWDATLNNNAKWIDGQETGAVSISKIENGYLQLPTGVVETLVNFTFATWMKPGNNHCRIFDFGNGTSTFMMLNLGTNSIRYKITCKAGTYSLEVPYAISADSWTHFALVQDSAEIRIYANGILVGEGMMEKVVYPKDMGVTSNNYIGRSQWPNDPYCDHVYDDFRFYDKVLDSENIIALYQGKTPTSIDAVNSSKMNDNAVYNLNGQKVSTKGSLRYLPKGVYIINNKKYVVK